MLVTKGTEVCVYCAGAGYLQLVLWGTETCPCCHGTGKVKNNQNRLFDSPGAKLYTCC